MVTLEQLREICLALPGTSASEDGLGFSVQNRGKEKALAWAWKERREPKAARVPNPSVFAVRVAGEDAKQFLIGAMPEVFFTEPHYNGFPAILVRLETVEIPRMEALIMDAWRIQAPRALVKEFESRVVRSD